MLSAYGTDKGCLTEFPATAGAVPEGVVWLDMVEPSAEEEKAVEAALQIDIPTREELAEIEASSRLYQEDGAAFMTANLIRRGENDRPNRRPSPSSSRATSSSPSAITTPRLSPPMFTAP